MLEERNLPNDPFATGQLPVLGAGLAALSLNTTTSVRVLLNGWPGGNGTPQIVAASTAWADTTFAAAPAAPNVAMRQAGLDFAFLKSLSG